MEEKDLIAKIQALKRIEPEKGWVKTARNQVLGPVFDPKILLFVPAILIAGLFYYNNLNQRLALEKTELEVMTLNLKTLQGNLAKTTVELGKISQPEKAVAVEKDVVSSIERGREVVRVAKEMAKRPKDSSKTLATIDEVEAALSEMEASYAEKQKQLASRMIGDLEKSSLNENQKSLLEEAEECYNKGDFSNALIKTIEASQSR